MTIYTRKGDAGQTSLADGSRVSKSSLRVEAYGTVDEANSAIGYARAARPDALMDDVLHFVQQRLFNCSSRLALPAVEVEADRPGVTDEDVAFLEHAVDRFEATTGPLDHFIIEGGTELAARLQLARAITRRAERRIVALSASEPVEPHVLAFVNRLADTLFAAARYANVADGQPEEAWAPRAQIPRL